MCDSAENALGPNRYDHFLNNIKALTCFEFA